MYCAYGFVHFKNFNHVSKDIKYLHYTCNIKIQNVSGQSNKILIHTTNLYLQPANEKKNFLVRKKINVKI